MYDITYIGYILHNLNIQHQPRRGNTQISTFTLTQFDLDSLKGRTSFRLSKGVLEAVPWGGARTFQSLILSFCFCSSSFTCLSLPVSSSFCRLTTSGGRCSGHLRDFCHVLRPCQLCPYLIQERVNKAKHLQFVSGVSSPPTG